MDSPLEQFLNTDWNELLPRLAKFAESCVKRYSWSTGGALPKGCQVEDLVAGAIEKTLAGLKGTEGGNGVRIWKPENVELPNFLMGVIKSDVSALAKSSDHRVVMRTQEIDDKISSEVSDDGGRFSILMDALQPIVADDAEVVDLITAIQEIIDAGDDANSKEVMELTGFSYSQYNNAKRRLMAAINKTTKKGDRK